MPSVTPVVGSSRLPRDGALIASNTFAIRVFGINEWRRPRLIRTDAA